MALVGFRLAGRQQTGRDIRIQPLAGSVSLGHRAVGDAYGHDLPLARVQGSRLQGEGQLRSAQGVGPLRPEGTALDPIRVGVEPRRKIDGRNVDASAVHVIDDPGQQTPRPSPHARAQQCIDDQGAGLET